LSAFRREAIDNAAMLKPMLASLDDAPLVDAQLVYEPKYDGIRAIAEVRPDGPTRLWSRLGNEKTRQFPEVAAALTRWARRLPHPAVLDGEIVALDPKGQPTGFQQLQGRIHVSRGQAPGGATAFVAFDLLRLGPTDLREQPLHERRAALVRLLKSVVRSNDGTIRLSQQVLGDGRALYEQALARGWEGLIAKHVDSRYRSGKRTPDWRKLKIVNEQEFVIGGWTAPQNTRAYFGALLLGVYDADGLTYVGHVGTGFNERELAKVMSRLKPLEVKTSPFLRQPKTNERPHWVRPELVAQVKFTEWTSDGILRHPVYLGLRDDKKPADVRREIARQPSETSKARLRRGAASGTPTPPSRLADVLVGTLREWEAGRRDGVLDLGNGQTLSVTNLHKVFWPRLKLTKGDLFRYYVQVSAALLPVIADRPLVMKRFPNGVAAKPFYQHRAPDVPANIRVEAVPTLENGKRAVRPHIIGGDLLTLLYTTQLAAISQDPWFSRIQSLPDADYVALDLDPADGVSFRQVLDVARAIRDELASMGAKGFPKTSGASGLHVYIPLPSGTPYEAGQIFAQIVATVVAHKHPKLATVERAVGARGKRVYVDYLQNIQGKTLASAYSARASDYAGVSTPLTWEEVESGVDRETFTITTVPDRLRAVGDLWERFRKAKGVDIGKAAKYGK